MSYWRPFGTTLIKECYRTWRGELLASLGVSVASYIFAVHSNDLHAWDNLKIVIESNVAVLGSFALWHLIRTPYLLHMETVVRVADETKLEVLRKQATPHFVTEVDAAIWDYTSGNRFYVHTHIVNTTDAVSNIRRITLKNRATQEVFRSVPFSEASLILRGRVKLDVIVADNKVESYRQSRILAPFEDSLRELESTAYSRGIGSVGWVLFEMPHSFEAGHYLPLSLVLQDAFGGVHEGDLSSVPIDFGAVL